jgi:flagellar basal-body rod modification protein FlgD
VADGNYTFSVNATLSGNTLTDAAGLTFGTVASVSTGSTGVTLNVPAIGKFTMDAVKQVL